MLPWEPNSLKTPELFFNLKTELWDCPFPVLGLFPSSFTREVHGDHCLGLFLQVGLRCQPSSYINTLSKIACLVDQAGLLQERSSGPEGDNENRCHQVTVFICFINEIQPLLFVRAAEHSV